MNTANLQLEGLIMAVAGINRALVAKGIITAEELDRALAVAEQTALGEDRVEALSPAHRDAIVFPVRVLRLANTTAVNHNAPSFAELAKRVGETKGPHNDQQ